MPGTEVAELDYQVMSWPQPRRLVLIWHRVAAIMEKILSPILNCNAVENQPAFSTPLYTP